MLFVVRNREPGECTRFMLRILAFCVMTGFQVGWAEVPDTTAVRKPTPPKKSVSEVLLYVPSTVLQIPIYLVRTGARPIIKGISIPSEIKKFPKTVFDPDNMIIPVGSVGSRSGISAGLSFNFRNLASTPDSLRFAFTYSTQDYQKYRFAYRAPTMFLSATGLTAHGSYQDRTRERFFGIGFASLLSEEVSYRLEQTNFIVSVDTKIAPGIALSISGGYTKSQVFDGENPDFENRLDSIQLKLSLTDEDIRPSKVWSIGAGLKHDSRNNKGQPSAGGTEQIQLTYYRGPKNSGDVEFYSTSVDLRRYIHVYDQRILALRLLARSIDQPGSASPTPFYLLNRFRGQRDLRGFRTDRFTDNDLALASVEYRYPVWDIIDALLLLDAGRVFSEIEKDFTLQNWEWNYGFGLRFWKPDRVIISATFAHSNEGNRYYLQAGGEF